jgi:hypothetical protein
MMMPLELRGWHFAPTVLGILLTSKCNIACRHCCNDSHPARDEQIELETLDRLVAQARDLPSIRSVGFSGGEPLLKRKLLRHGIRSAAALGYEVAVTTNGSWGRSGGAAALMRNLRSDGLTSLWISASAFHREFVALETMVCAVQHAIDAGLDVHVNVVSGNGFAAQDVRDALTCDPGLVQVYETPCLPTGKAGELFDIEHSSPGDSQPMGDCSRHFARMAVDLDGTVWPCCSPGGFTPPLALGSSRAHSLREIAGDAQERALISILATVGPAFFLPFLRRSQVGEKLPERFQGQCHLCHAMLSDPHARAVVGEACRQLLGELESAAVAA